MNAIAATPGQQRPGDARHLVGKRDGHDFERSPRQKLRQPRIFLRVLPGPPQHGMCPDHKNTPQIAVALLGNRPKLLFAPGRILARDEPNPGGKIAPNRKAFGSVTVAAIALAPMMPIPGTLSSRLLASFARCCTVSRLSIEPIIVCSAWS